MWYISPEGICDFPDRYGKGVGGYVGGYVGEGRDVVYAYHPLPVFKPFASF